MTPQTLKPKLIAYIKKNGPVSFDTIWARGVEKNIPAHVMEAAITLLHRDKHWIDTKTKDGTIYYSIHVEKPKVDKMMDAKAYVTSIYPRPGKNGVPAFIMPFPEIDYSWIFLRGEELERYKCEAKGRVYIPGKKKIYERKAKKKKLTPVQGELMSLFPS